MLLPKPDTNSLATRPFPVKCRRRMNQLHSIAALVHEAKEFNCRFTLRLRQLAPGGIVGNMD